LTSSHKRRNAVLDILSLAHLLLPAFLEGDCSGSRIYECYIPRPAQMRPCTLNMFRGRASEVRLSPIEHLLPSQTPLTKIKSGDITRWHMEVPATAARRVKACDRSLRACPVSSSCSESLTLGADCADPAGICIDNAAPDRDPAWELEVSLG
jgi:hypothetical protein